MSRTIIIRFRVDWGEYLIQNSALGAASLAQVRSSLHIHSDVHEG
jgi:hypothetical protein